MDKLTPMEFKNQRIITTKTLSEEYGTNEQNISKNFTRNQERFVEGKHYFKLEGEELKEFKGYVLNDESLKFVSVLYLWTEKGAARHAKILDTDEAWEVYEELEETYFRVRESVQALNTSQLSPELQMFNKLFQAMACQELENKKIKEDIKETKEEIQGIRDIIEINPSAAWRKEVNRLLNAIGKKINNYNLPKNESYNALKDRAKCRPNVLVENLKKKAINNGMAPSKVSQLNMLDVLENDPRLREIYVAIVKDMAIKHGVKM